MRLLWGFGFVFFLIWSGKDEKIPGYLLRRVISLGALSGKVGVRISPSSALAR